MQADKERAEQDKPSFTFNAKAMFETVQVDAEGNELYSYNRGETWQEKSKFEQGE